jgi:hypothetical protein
MINVIHKDLGQAPTAPVVAALIIIAFASAAPMLLARRKQPSGSGTFRRDPRFATRHKRP